MNDTIPTELKEAYKEIIDSQRNSAVFFGDSTYELCYGFMHAAYTLGSEWKWISDSLPEIMPDKGYSENVLAIVDGYPEMMVMCYSEIIGDNVSYGWCNCYGDINGDGEYDADYKVIKWQYLPQSK